MPIDPQVFLSYGRPDKELARRITAGLWNNRIDCYNYLAQPIMERLGGDSDHSKYLNVIRLFVALLSGDTLWRKAVIDEIFDIDWLVRERLRNVPRVYVTTRAILEGGPYPEDDNSRVIDPTRTGGVTEIVQELMRLMGSELVAHSQKGWETNKALYFEQWQKVDAELNGSADGEIVLPSAKLLMDREVRGAWLGTKLKSELELIKTETNRWIFLLCLAPILEHAGQPMGAELRQLVPRYAHLKDPIVGRALHEPVAPKEYRDDEKIDQVASVIRGLRRIEKAIDWMRCDEALAIAQRFTWPTTRRLLLCGIYYCAAGVADDATSRAICDELDLAR